MAWEFKREESKGFSTNIPEGDYRIRVKSAEKAVSKNSGNDMLVLQFDVSGFAETLYHYIVFLPDRPEITNRNLTQFYNSFKDIPMGDFNLQNWVGKVGACRVKQEEYNGNAKAKIAFFIHKDKQANLPAWKEPSGSTGAAPAADADGFIPIPDNIGDDLPF